MGLQKCLATCDKADNHREDDVAWPKKNIVGRQELEVRIDKEHISFEVSPTYTMRSVVWAILMARRRRSVHWLM